MGGREALRMGGRGTGRGAGLIWLLVWYFKGNLRFGLVGFARGCSLGEVEGALVREVNGGRERSAAAGNGTTPPHRLGPQSTVLSRGPELFLAGPSTSTAELSAPSPHDCLVAQSTASWVASHEPTSDAGSTMQRRASGTAELAKSLCDPFDLAGMALTDGCPAVRTGGVLTSSSIEG